MTTRSERSLPAGTRLAAFDVDGVFTDGRFYVSDDGVESKAFHTQDGFGIRRLILAGIDVAVISGRDSGAVRQRMAELGVPHVLLGVSDKVAAFEDLIGKLQLTAGVCVYTGDDIPDLPLLQRAGFAVAVQNAVDEVKAACDYTTRAAGGFGAVREVCELILHANGDGPANR